MNWHEKVHLHKRLLGMWDEEENFPLNIIECNTYSLEVFTVSSTNSLDSFCYSNIIALCNFVKEHECDGWEAKNQRNAAW